MSLPNGFKTFLGIIITAASVGVEMLPDLLAAFPEVAWLPKAGAAAGLILAAYGRVTAQGPVNIKKDNAGFVTWELARLYAIAAVLIGFMIWLLSGCSIASYGQKHPLLSEMTVKAATVEFCKANPDLADDVARIAHNLTVASISGDDQVSTLQRASVFVRQQIDYSKLQPETALLLDMTIDVFQAEGAKIISGNVEPTREDVKRVVTAVATWVMEAATLAGNRK